MLTDLSDQKIAFLMSQKCQIYIHNYQYLSKLIFLNKDSKKNVVKWYETRLTDLM